MSGALADRMGDRAIVKLINERRILTLLRIQGPMTRADMARRLSLTPATLTNLVEALLGRDLVAVAPAARRAEARGEPGRPGVDVTLSPTGAYFLGVEIGVGIIRFALLNLALAVVGQAEQTVARDIDPEAVLQIVSTQVRRLAKAHAHRERIDAVVLTVPGLVRSDGFVVHLPILGWRDVDLQTMTEQVLQVPTSVENNANAAAFGEVYLRPRLERDCVLHLKLGSGCGGAVIINGRLLRGAFGTGTELGHIRIAADGPLCSCGQRGCLEPHVTLGALQRLMGEDAAAGPMLDLPARVAAAAAAGDEHARRAIASIADHLATGIAGLVNAFNPRTVVLGGAMRPVIAAVLPEVARRVSDRIVPGMAAPAIELSKLGPMECAIGAAAIAHHHALDIAQIEAEPSI